MNGNRFLLSKKEDLGSLMGFHDQGKELNGQGIEPYGQKVGYHKVRLFTIMWF